MAETRLLLSCVLSVGFFAVGCGGDASDSGNPTGATGSGEGSTGSASVGAGTGAGSTGGGVGSSTTGTTGSGGGSVGGTLCGGVATPPATYEHVVWMVFENELASAILGNAELPFTNELTTECGYATDYDAIQHPSLPNYIAMTSGDTQGISGDSSGQLDADNLFHQVESSGREWRTYSSQMPSNCYTSDWPDSSAACYTAHHEPVIYYSNVHSNCQLWDVPLGQTSSGALATDLDSDTLPAFAIIGPGDDCGDSKAGGEVDPPKSDAFLKDWVARIQQSAAYQAGKTAIFITYDEGGDFSNNDQHVLTIVIAPSVKPGTQASEHYTHYSLLRTAEEMLGIQTHLLNAASATSMRAGFNL